MREEPFEEKRARGRPRSGEVRATVLESALALLQKGDTRALTMENIAAHAKVSKATLYRWWSSPAAIALEGFLEAVSPQIAWPDSPNLREALIGQATLLTRLFTRTTYGCTVRKVIADGQCNHELSQAFVDKFMVPRRQAASERLAAAQERGELRRDVDLEVVLDMIYAPIYLRFLTRHLPLDDEFVTKVVDTALLGLTPR